MSKREESLGTGEEFRESARVGFRGHSGGQGACVVSSAQLGLVREFPLGGTGSVGFGFRLFPQFQFFKKGAVSFGLGPVKVVEKAAPATDHRKKTTAGCEVFDGIFEVGREVVDPFRKECDLDIGGTGIFVVQSVACDDLAFCQRGHKKKTLCENNFESMPEA